MRSVIVCDHVVAHDGDLAWATSPAANLARRLEAWLDSIDASSRLG